MLWSRFSRNVRAIEIGNFIRTNKLILMKDFLIKYHNHFNTILFLGIGIGTIYPDETVNDNYVGGAIFAFAAICGFLSLIGIILNYKNK